MDSQITDKPGSNRKLLIGCLVGGAVIFCIAVAVILIIFFLRSGGLSLSKSATPSHYGVFIKQGGNLVELEEQELYNLPLDGELANVVSTTSIEPVIVIWRQDVNLDYLEMYALGQYLGQQAKIPYKVTPKDNGVLELTPTGKLTSGSYCLIQGNPLAAFLPGWCFKINTQ